jgi:hypothetical protein
MDPVTLYKSGSERLIASVDVAGWLADGWATEPVELASPAAESEEPIDEPSEIEPEAGDVKSRAKRK